ncbi:MAG: hypothetical protein LBG17_02505 [Bacteroidales bacterium]|jgi:hypothetical protein|nr:hypothetical protein [Bacteroidales bacterium]
MMAEYLHKINRNDLIRKFDLTPEKLQVVKPQYTLSDKIIRLAQLGFADDYITEISSCIRDIFDITKLLKNKRFLDFFSIVSQNISHSTSKKK